MILEVAVVQKLRQCQDIIVRIDLCHDGTCIRLTYWRKDRQGTGYHFAIFIISIHYPSIQHNSNARILLVTIIEYIHHQRLLTPSESKRLFLDL